MDLFPILDKMSNTVLRDVIRDRRHDAEAALFAYTEVEREAQRRDLPVNHWPKRRAILDVIARIRAAKRSPREANPRMFEFTEIDFQYARAFGIRLD